MMGDQLVPARMVAAILAAEACAILVFVLFAAIVLLDPAPLPPLPMVDQVNDE